MALPDEAQTRTEQYLSRIATGSGDIPDEPQTRTEQYLAYIAEDGGSGGSADVPTEEIAANTAARHTHDNKAVLDAITETTISGLEAKIAELQAYVGLDDDSVVGLQVDYENKTFTRLAGAKGLSAGTDFDKFRMFGGQRKCCVADDGSVNAWYGGDGYAEDGSNGQAMKYYPVFYYMVVPLKYEPASTGIGYVLRKANYYASDYPRPGFKRFPAFYDANGNEIDYYLGGAYEASIYDADGGDDGAGAYLELDEQVLDAAADKLCSIAGVKPASGLSQSLNPENIEQTAENRGGGWHSEFIKTVSAEQYLMLLEFGTLNIQAAAGMGIVDITDNSSYNCASLTGSTAALGNGSGMAAETVNEINGTETAYSEDGKAAVSIRGKENPYGDMWGLVCGVNIWGDGSMGGGQPYICSDLTFKENRNSDNYEPAGFTLANAATGYISAMGYSEEFDYLFLPAELSGDSSLPVGDCAWITADLDGYRKVQHGGRWSHGLYAGGFCWDLSSKPYVQSRLLGGRLVHIPTAGTDVYAAVIASWEAQMAA